MDKVPFPPGKGEVKWVTTDWLNDHLDDDITILDAQPNVHDFIKGHIRGAVYLAEESLRLSQKGRPHVWLPSDLAQSVLEEVGVRANRPVVVYTRTNVNVPTGDGVPQGMIAYSLARYGHSKVLILDGGLDKWVEEGRELDVQYRPGHIRRFEVRTRNELFIGYEEFKRVKDRQGVVHIDSRPPSQYQGKSPWRKEGHIPGAINIPWSEMFMPNNLCLLRSKEELTSITSSSGATKDNKIICHCGSGRKAAAQLCVLKWYLGFPNVRLFEGSFTDWCAHPDNPTLTGEL